LIPNSFLSYRCCERSSSNPLTWRRGTIAGAKRAVKIFFRICTNVHFALNNNVLHPMPSGIRLPTFQLRQGSLSENIPSDSSVQAPNQPKDNPHGIPTQDCGVRDSPKVVPEMHRPSRFFFKCGEPISLRNQMSSLHRFRDGYEIAGVREMPNS